VNNFIEQVDKEHNQKANQHQLNYCDKKCPAGDKGSNGWHDPYGNCCDCEFNPYRMGVLKR